MNFPLEEIEDKNIFNMNEASLKRSINQDIYKNISSNKKNITLNDLENLSNSQELKNSSINKQNVNYNNQKYFALTNNNEDNEEEEEINSDEYVSSTNLDVETNTYINLQNNTKNEENKNNNRIVHYPGRQRKNIVSEDINNKIEKIKQQKNNIFINNKEMNNNNKKININNNINLSCDNYNRLDFNRKINNKSDFINYENISKDNENTNTIDRRMIFTPNKEGKKKVKVLREIIFKKLEDRLKNKKMKTITHSHTISNNLKIIDNDLVKHYFKLNFNQNKNKSPKITINNNATSKSIDKTIDNKYTSMNEIQQNIPLNNDNIDLSIYKKNIIKNIGSININDQKYHFFPQSIKKSKTQGRVGKIVYNKKNNRKNYLYINSNTKNKINKTINTPVSLNHNNKINRISPLNKINDSKNYNSICTNKLYPFHSLKNLKIENVQNSIKKYLLGHEYFKIFPYSQEKNNKIEKDHHQIIKDSSNDKFIEKKAKKNNRIIKYNLNNLNLNKYKIKKIIPLTIKSRKNQLKRFNSYYPKKINQNAFNNITNDQILTTISNNRKIDIVNNFKKTYANLLKSKIRNTSDKKHNNEKNLNKKHELSCNILPEYCKNNIISSKKMRNLKNKIFSSDYSNIEYKIDNVNNKKNKPQTKRIKLDLKNEDKKNMKKYNTRNNMNNKNIENIFSDNNNINTLKEINFKTLPYKCLSPNSHNLKKIMENNNPSKMKELYKNKNNVKKKGKNNNNIFLSSSIMENNNFNHKDNNSSIFQNNSINSNNIIFFKKLQKEKFREKYSNSISNTLNFNIENISNFSTQNKKIIVFNNVNNYNINNTNNTLNNITNIKNSKNEQQQVYQKNNEDLNIFSSILNKNYYKNPKKIYINNSNINYNKENNTIIFMDKNNDSGSIRQNIIYMENSKNKNNNNNEIFEINKYKNKKNMIYKLKKNNNLNKNNDLNKNNVGSPIFFNHANNIINNKLNNYSNSNNKERNTINNNSHANLYLLKDKKKINNETKNMTIDIFDKIPNSNQKKSISHFQEIKNDYKSNEFF